MLYTKAKGLFAAASMNLREWASNSKEFMEFIPLEDKKCQLGLKVLGISWNLTDDTLSVPSPLVSKIEGISAKREILQVIASIFDPLRYFAPTVLEAELFVKGQWTEKFDWDEKLEERKLSEWITIYEHLRDIPIYYFMPKYIGIPKISPEVVNYQLVCFSNALAKAYTAAVY